MSGKAMVYLISTGPGEPEFISVKALRLIQQADVIVYDRLVSTKLLTLIPAGTARIIHGHPYGTPRRQAALNELLLRLAYGRHVVYLKGGDPAAVGAGGEELSFLARHGIGCEMVPVDGTTSGSRQSRHQSLGRLHDRCH